MHAELEALVLGGRNGSKWPIDPRLKSGNYQEIIPCSVLRGLRQKILLQPMAWLPAVAPLGCDFPFAVDEEPRITGEGGGRRWPPALVSLPVRSEQQSCLLPGPCSPFSPGLRWRQHAAAPASVLGRDKHKSSGMNEVGMHGLCCCCLKWHWMSSVPHPTHAAYMCACL